MGAYVPFTTEAQYSHDEVRATTTTAAAAPAPSSTVVVAARRLVGEAGAARSSYCVVLGVLASGAAP